jgi:hypothetical protein
MYNNNEPVAQVFTCSLILPLPLDALLIQLRFSFKKECLVGRCAFGVDDSFIPANTILVLVVGCLRASLKTCRMHFPFKDKAACIFTTQVFS